MNISNNDLKTFVTDVQTCYKLSITYDNLDDNLILCDSLKTENKENILASREIDQVSLETWTSKYSLGLVWVEDPKFRCFRLL